MPAQRMFRASAVLSLVILAAISCGRVAPGSPSGEEREDLDTPPDVTVRSEDRSLELPAWAYCFGNVCADGFPPEEPPDIGTADRVFVEFPLPGWSFTAYFTPADDRCGREIEARLTEADGGAFLLEPVGYAGTYDVRLFGSGGGDLVTTFRWTTTVDGPVPAPSAELAILADHDGAVDSYGVALGLTNLAETPEDVTAVITVTSAEGNALTFDAVRAELRCAPEGTVAFDGPDRAGLDAARLGSEPFTYKVEVVMDGTRYVATASWPEDVIAGNEPSVALRFSPELPSLEPA